MARWRRWLALLSLLFVAALVGLQLYLGSSFAARLVATQLGDLLASPVDIARLDGRLVGSTSVHGLTLHDASSGDPLLTIDCLVVDVSLLSAARGRRLPQQVDVHGAHLHLRFNREGKLITRLPRLPSAGGLPRLRLNHLRVTLDQEGRPPLTIQGVRATIEPRDGENLQGLIDDPVLGLVQAGGSFRKGRLHLALRSDGVPLSRERFRSFPFVPTTLTQHVELSGIVPMKLDLWLGEPGTRPRYRVDFRKAQARLLQPGQPPFVVASTAGVVEGSEGGFLFQGAARDPEWGNWRIVADRAPGRPGVTLHLDTDEVILDAEHLVRVPYVPRSIWDQVRASGSAGAQLVVRLPPGGKAGLRYRAELRPRDAEVHISAVDLNASQTRGLVVIEDGHVTLKKVQAATAEGTIQCDGDLDFRTTPSRMQFGVAVQALRLRKLPGSWELPRALDGKVTGSAQLTVTTLPGRLRTEGKGQGRIDEASIAGIRAREPIPLRLTADGRRFRLLPRVPLMDTLLRPVSRRIEAGRDQVVRAFYQVIGRPVPTYLVADFAWEGEMAELMQHLQMELPEKVRGALALQGRLALPLENPRDVRQHDV
ncbi:MAG: AsmA-like C-terminal region-containing protein [Gemmataceae bacterium]